jgi:quinol monooxygenase YgiN
MTIECIRYKVNIDQREPFIQSYVKASLQLNESPFCLAYELSECEEEPGVFILRIEWTSTEDHMNGFRKSVTFCDFFTNVKPFFNDIQEMRHYQLTEIASRKRMLS